jgi:hypothetical protein
MKFKEIIIKRWKFYLISYLLGYAISLLITGIPSIIYLIPIKITALSLAIIIGNAFYHASKKMPVYYYPIKGFKYTLVILVIMLVFYLLKSILFMIGIDITPLLA